MITLHSQVSPAVNGRIVPWLILWVGAMFYPTESISKQVTFNNVQAAQRSTEPTYQVKTVLVVTCDLPKKFLPESVPSRPIDETLRVGLVLPAFVPDAERNTTWLQPASYHNWSQFWADPPAGSETGGVKFVDRVILNFADPASAALPRIIGRLFPHTEIIRSQTDLSQYDLVLKIALISGNISNPDNTFRGAWVTGTIAAVESGGKTISTITESGRGEATKSIYWSEGTQGRAAGVPALQMMLNRLVRNLVEDSSFLAYVREASARKARPSELETTARFDDSVGLFPNGRLDGGENAALLFKVHNRGSGPAFGVRLRISSTTNEIAFPAETEIGDLPPGGDKEVRLTIGGSLGLETGILKLPIETIEKRGYGGRQVILEIATQKLVAPTLEIADISLNDPGGRSRGADGRPTNGSTLEAVVRIRNSGPGDAAGVTITASSAATGVEILEPKVGVPSIPANGVGEGRMHVRLPVTFDARDLSLLFRAVESRGAEVAQASRAETWPVQVRKPAVEVTYRLYDGNSAGSRGDRDGVANNGEKLELVLTPVNRGALVAHDVRVTLVSRQQGLTLNQERFEVGDLPAQAEGSEQRVGMALSRILGRDLPIDKLPLVLTITQRDFPPREQPILLAFQARRPELVANIASASPLVEGGSATLWLELSNDGLLAAEGARVEVSTDSPGIELLDELGAPTRKVLVDVGAVGARTSAPRIQIKAHVRRNLSSAAAFVRVVASQQDFPPVEQRATFSVLQETASVISAVPPPSAEPPRLPAMASSASVSFRRYESGDHISQESVLLPFEVQSQSMLDTVRLQQNGLDIDLSNPRQVPSHGMSLWQYEPRVHLGYGENDFEVVVVTAEGMRTSRTLHLKRDRNEGKLWVAVVGVSKYADNRITDLKFAKEDATAVFAYYRDRFALPESQMIHLIDETATLANIKRVLGTDLVAKANNPNDTVILYFAGHGKKEVDSGSIDSDGFSKYVLPYDANLSDLFGTGLSMDDMALILRRLRSERVVLIIDSCFSGAATGGRSPFDPTEGTRSAVTNEFLSRMASVGKGRVILTASGANELARERTDMGHGVFTKFLLQGLQGDGDEDGDGLIDVDEVYKFVSQQVSAATNGQQNPMKKASTQTGTIVLGKTAARSGH